MAAENLRGVEKWMMVDSNFWKHSKSLKLKEKQDWFVRGGIYRVFKDLLNILEKEDDENDEFDWLIVKDIR